MDTVVDIGSRRQLLIDDHVIARTGHLKRTFHPVVKHGPPVLQPEHPWEGVGTAPWPSVFLFGDVIRDRDTGRYRMWYTTAKADMSGGQHDVLYAESDDGLTWHKPLDVGKVDYRGSCCNNILVADTSAQNVIRRDDDPDPSKRYRLLSYDRSVDAYAWRYSPDGLHWSDPQVIEALQGPGMFDNLNADWDPVRACYVIAVKKFDNRYEHPVVGRLPGPGFRRWFMTTSPDGLQCSPLVEMPGLVDTTDRALYMEGERCSGLNTYGLSMHAYGDLLIGIQWLFRVTDTEGFHSCHGGPMDGRLLVSRDPTRQWHIPTRQFVLPHGRKGQWDGGMICGIANRPVTSPDGTRWWLYYGGWTAGHGINRRRACIGLAELRLDGYASIGSPDTEGTLETKPIRFRGNRLRVNIDARGTDTEGTPNHARVGVLDEQGRPIEGVTDRDCDPMHLDEVNHVVTWGGKADLSHLAGRPVRLVFRLRCAELYAFQFERGS